VSQAYVAFELNVSYLSGYNRVYEIGFGGMDNNCVAIAMDSCIGLAFFLGIHERRWWARLGCLVAALLMAHVVFMSFSRGGMMALLITAVAAFAVMPKRPIHYLIFVATLLAALHLAGTEVRTRFLSAFAESSQRDASSQSRLDLWADMWDSTLAHPILGLGPHNWVCVSANYGWPAGKEGHSLWIQILAEVGFPGLACLLAFYGVCLIRLFRLSRQAGELGDPWWKYLSQAVIVSIVGFAVSAQFVSLVGLEVPYYITLVGAAVLKLAPSQPDSNENWT
jgi:O-antigen ligase